MSPGGDGESGAPAAGPPTGEPGAGAEEEGSGDGGDSTGEIIQRGARKRTEFVIFFVWKEPTPSDALRGSMSAAVGEGAAPVGEAPAEGGLEGATGASLFSKKGSPAEPRTVEKAKARKERPVGLPTGSPPAPEIKVLAAPKPKPTDSENPMGQADPGASTGDSTGANPAPKPPVPAVAPKPTPPGTAPSTPGTVPPVAPKPPEGGKSNDPKQSGNPNNK